MIVLILIAFVGFVVFNPAEKVTVDLFFAPPFEGVPLVLALFVAFLFGAVGGLSAGALKILELQGRLRDSNRTRSQIEGELTTLRNLPLEEAEESAAPGSAP
jgi:uncharacterized integral membrane protein